MALIERCHFTISARAGADVELIGLPPNKLQAALEARPDVDLRVLTKLSRMIARRVQVTNAMRTWEFQRAVNVTFG